MNLDTFIKESLRSARMGLKEANTELRRNEAGGGYQMVSGKDGEIIFDVAVTVSNADRKEGAGKINVFSLQLGGGVEASQLAETVSRIKFKVVPDSTHH